MFNDIRHQLKLGMPLFLCLLALLAPAMSQSGGDNESQLRVRMEAFWDAMFHKNYEVASQYVCPESREMFKYKLQKPDFSKWKIVKLSFTSDSECEATINITRAFPMLPSEFEWSLLHTWIRMDGEWFFRPVIVTDPLGHLFGSSKPAAGTESRREEPAPSSSKQEPAKPRK